MITAATTPCYVSLNRLAKLTGHSRVTLLLRLKDGKLTADALLDIGGGKSLPLFRHNHTAGPTTVKGSTSHTHFGDPILLTTGSEVGIAEAEPDDTGAGA